MEPAQKATLTKQAKASGLSLGEFIRNRALDEDALLSALVAELRGSTAKATEAIDQLVERMDAREQSLTQREAATRRKAEAEFAGLDRAALARLFAGQVAEPQSTDR
jgi:uncharacterized coiled-coil protein SlyX